MWYCFIFFFSSRRRHTRFKCDWSSDVCSSDLDIAARGGLVLKAHLKPEAAAIERLAGRRVLAFAGIGDPGRFFRTLRGNGIDVAQGRAFAHHHAFSPGEIEALIPESKRDKLTLV